MNKVIYSDYWPIATRELAQRDGVMAQLILSYPNSVMSSRGQPFYTLVRSVVGQQISVKAADSIWARFVLLVPKVTPKHVLVQSMDSLRSVGLSARKAEYIHAIAEFLCKNAWGRRIGNSAQTMKSSKNCRAFVALGVGRQKCF